MVILGDTARPFQKGDIVIVRHTKKPIYTAHYLKRGGEKPVDEFGNPINPDAVDEVIRPGFPLREVLASDLLGRVIIEIFMRRPDKTKPL